jgi:hypothetical protein
LPSLLRQAEEWRKQRGLPQRDPCVRWQRCGVGEFALAETGIDEQDARVWTIRELLSNWELRAEGRGMHHCVASYVRACISRQTTIWSMAIEEHDRRQRVLTIEVDPSNREIVQAKRHHNEAPMPKDREVMGLWAQDQGLTVMC